MKYWIQFNKDNKIVASGFSNPPINAFWREHPNFSYTIEDCALEGTDFQKKVWQAIASIPLGQTIAYGDISSKIGGSAQSVGTACGKNKIPVVIPCHRVVGKSNKLAFSSGPEIKKMLLLLEGIEI